MFHFFLFLVDFTERVNVPVGENQCLHLIVFRGGVPVLVYCSQK